MGDRKPKPGEMDYDAAGKNVSRRDEYLKKLEEAADIRTKDEKEIDATFDVDDDEEFEEEGEEQSWWESLFS
jgi:hypothetical protein